MIDLLVADIDKDNQTSEVEERRHRKSTSSSWQMPPTNAHLTPRPSQTMRAQKPRQRVTCSQTRTQRARKQSRQWKPQNTSVASIRNAIGCLRITMPAKQRAPARLTHWE